LLEFQSIPNPKAEFEQAKEQADKFYLPILKEAQDFLNKIV
jgi:hypothetical protein